MPSPNADYEFETHPILTWGAVGGLAWLSLFSGLELIRLVPGYAIIDWPWLAFCSGALPFGVLGLLVLRLGLRVSLRMADHCVVLQEFRTFRWRTRVIDFEDVAGVKDSDFEDVSRLVMLLENGKSVDLGVLNEEGRKRFLREFRPVQPLGEGSGRKR